MEGAGEDAGGPGPREAHTPGGWRVREATPQDAELLFRWRHNDAQALSSRSGSPVPWAEHLRWLESSIARVDRVVLIVSDELGDVGTVRWEEREPGHWEASITVAPERRGQSLGRPLLGAGEERLSHDVEVTDYLAVVHTTNTPSKRLFERAGYAPDRPADERGFLRLRKASPGRRGGGQK